MSKWKSTHQQGRSEFLLTKIKGLEVTKKGCLPTSVKEGMVPKSGQLERSFFFCQNIAFKNLKSMRASSAMPDILVLYSEDIFG